MQKQWNPNECGHNWYNDMCNPTCIYIAKTFRDHDTKVDSTIWSVVVLYCFKHIWRQIHAITVVPCLAFGTLHHPVVCMCSKQGFSL